MKKTIFASLAAALLLTACFPSLNGEMPETQGETEQPSQPAGKLMMNGEHVIVVTSQPAGTSQVLVNMVLLGKAGFVVIHEDSNGRPGAPIAQSELLENGGIMVEVDMPSNLEDGETYFAMLHGDNGDGEFNEADDVALTDADGNDITMQFEVSDEIDEVASIAI